MITREEALNKYRCYSSEWYEFSFEGFINYIYDDFEQQLKEAQEKTIPFLTMVENRRLVEQLKEAQAYKTCDGCKHNNDGYCTKYYNAKYRRTDCSRLTEDRYEPKDDND